MRLAPFIIILAFDCLRALGLNGWADEIETNIALWYRKPQVCGAFASPFDAAGWIHIANVTDNPKFCYHACTSQDRQKSAFGYPIEGSFSVKYESLDVWFWLFAARRNSATAPLVLIFREGQPGVPTTQKVFDKTGPCNFGRTRGEPSLNHRSYNDEVNILYIDSPSPVGLSRGISPGSSIHDARYYEWEFLQNFLETFPEYKGREIALWSYDFGAHHALNMAMLIHEENEKIQNGSISGTFLNLNSVGLVSPLVHMPIQQTAAVAYLRNNRHRSIIDNDTYDDLMRVIEFHERGWQQCAVDWKKPCARELRESRHLFRDLTLGYAPDPCRGRTPTDELDPSYDIPADIRDKHCKEPRVSFDPWNIQLERAERPRQLAYMVPDGANSVARYLNSKNVKGVLGGDKREPYYPFDRQVFKSMFKYQEFMRSSVEVLGQVVRTGLRVLIVGGDCDSVSNEIAMREILNSIKWNHSSTWREMQPKNVSFPRGETWGPLEKQHTGELKTVGNLTWLLLNNRGHDLEWEDARMMRVIFYQHIFGRSFGEWE